MAHLEAINRAKIVCTLGPASNTEERIVELIRAGMDVVRLNFSHGTYEEHREVIRRVRKVAEELGVPIPIIQDLSGPKLRTGSLQEAPVFLEPGARFVLTAREVPGNRHEVSVNYPELIEDLLPGDRLLLADGALELRVKEKTDSDLICEVIVGGELGEHKGINVPDRMLRVPSLTDKDRQDLAFGLQEGVDWVALSFVRTADDVLELKRLISRAPREVPVIAKIEKRAALDNLETILLVADGVMVARGDLGVEIPMPDVPWAQKEIIHKANQVGVPVITATQMLESMIHNPRPTRAELTDVANAILDGTDAVMLSGETAVGKYPVEAVRIMQQIADAVTRHPLYNERMQLRNVRASSAIPDAISQTACELATFLNARCIICCTRSGRTAVNVAKYRPPMPIIGVSPNPRVLRELQLYWGIVPLQIAPPENTDDIIAKAKRAVLDARLARLSDTVVIVAGVPLEVEGTTNMIKADTL